MQRIEIRDLEDPRLVDYQNLKDATLARRRGRFIVEGRGNLEVLLGRSSHEPESILLSERTFRSMASRLGELAPRCPVYVAERGLLDRVVGFPIHRGCLAVCRRPAALDPLELATRLIREQAAARILVLEGVRDHDNLGGLFRNALALGGHGILLSPECSDPLYRKAIRTSMGGALCLPFAVATQWPTVLGSLRQLGYEILALDPAEGGGVLRDLEIEGLGPVAIVVGTEGPGLSDAALECADLRVRIPMESGVDSLNVAMAAGIALYALRSDGLRDEDPVEAGHGRERRGRRES